MFFVYTTAGVFQSASNPFETWSDLGLHCFAILTYNSTDLIADDTAGDYTRLFLAIRFG